MANKNTTHQNRRRKSGFVLVRPRHMTPILAGALSATIVLHLLGFSLLDLFDIGIKLSAVDNRPADDDDRIVVAVTDDDDLDVPVPKPPDEEPLEVVPIEELDPVDFEDLPFEELVIAPGETEINLSNDGLEAMALLSPEENSDILEQIKQGFDEPAFVENMAITDNPVQVALPPNEIDPDKWYKEQLEGAGGKDDSNVPGSSKTLNELLAMAPGTHGKGDYSRLGADLLFEYDKSVLKNSAKISLLKLAALIYKNPDTIFIIEGHTDSFGSKEYNTLLSLMRANAVRNWLKGNGVDLSRIYIRACGDSMPVVSTKGSREKQAANRRVEIHMRQKKKELPEGSMPASYPVDMETPIIQQLSSKVQLPSLPAARPVPAEEKANVPSQTNTPSNDESIPMADPADVEIPDAEEA